MQARAARACGSDAASTRQLATGWPNRPTRWHIDLVRMAKSGILILFVAMCNTAIAQFSGFVSSTYLSHGNPLFNYAQIGDRLYQGYWELGLKAGHLGVRYAGGTVLFTTFADRSFLDHHLTLSWESMPPTVSTQQSRETPEDTSGEDESEVVSDPLQPDTNSGPLDSIGISTIVSAALGARHDKEIFREYDNYAASLGGNVRWGFGDAWMLRAVGEVGYRKYPFIDELSNITGLCRVEVRRGVDQGMALGVRGSGGLKYFTQAAFDTSRFEAVRTYVLVKKQGAGKGGAIITTKEPSAKQILSNADVRHTTQITSSAFVRIGWTNGSLEGEILYRYNPNSSARVLTRTPGTATINEDIYNDYYSYSGPEAQVKFHQVLPATIQATISLEHQRKHFGAPALRLDGEEIALSRLDLRRSIELYLSRWFALSDELGVDLALSASVLRNESNDDYNDFSSWTIGLSAGLGF
jgi:hypothetical protein